MDHNMAFSNESFESRINDIDTELTRFDAT